MASIATDIFYQFFKDDGKLRDIFVTRTSKKDWNQLWDFILQNSSSVLVVDGQETHKLPQRIHGLFAELYNKHIYLYITYEGTRFALHFIHLNKIEFDVCPREIKDVDGLIAILNFMKRIARLLGKNISLSMENSHNHPLLTITPAHKCIPHYRSMNSLSLKIIN